jgi:hypothetical protein
MSFGCSRRLSVWRTKPPHGIPRVGLEVLVVVPAERRNAVSRFEAQSLQSDGERRARLPKSANE